MAVEITKDERKFITITGDRTQIEYIEWEISGYINDICAC